MVQLIEICIIRLYFSPAHAVTQEHRLHEIQTWTRRYSIDRTTSNFSHMGLFKTMRLQWPFKHMIMNANYRQSVHIISNTYTFNTPIIIIRRSSFTVHAIQGHKNY